MYHKSDANTYSSYNIYIYKYLIEVKKSVFTHTKYTQVLNPYEKLLFINIAVNSQIKEIPIDGK